MGSVFEQPWQRKSKEGNDIHDRRNMKERLTNGLFKISSQFELSKVRILIHNFETMLEASVNMNFWNASALQDKKWKFTNTVRACLLN